MRTLTRLSVIVASAAALIASTAGGAVAGNPATSKRPTSLSPHWTKISSDIGFGFASAGLFRTADGRLHVVWPDDVKGIDSLHYSTVGGRAKLVNSGTIVSQWAAVSEFPRLVPAPHGIFSSGLRVIFDGANGKGGSPYNLGTFYSATASSAGTGWTLMPGSLSHSESPPLTDDAATSLFNGEPVTAWPAANTLTYHLGIDPAVPATAPDVQIPLGPSGAMLDPTMLTASGGTPWAAWFNSSGTSTMGYWADPIPSGTSGMRKAPGSGGKNLNNSQPLQPVAFASRSTGGEFLAYCVPTKIITCSHIALWPVGGKKAVTVPGSASGQDSKVALAPAPGGHMWVLWFDYKSNVIQAVRTSGAGLRFGAVLTIVPPPHFFSFQGLEAEGSKGPLDIVALETQKGAHSSPAFFAAQILPPLTLHSAPAKVGVSGKVTFTVLDATTPVSGVQVSFLGSKAVTDSQGVVHFTVKKGTKAGKHRATAFKPGYSSGVTTVKIT
jgi:hypothetical protein